MRTRSRPAWRTGTRPRLANATGLNGDRAFHGIVAEGNPQQHLRVLVAGEFLKSDPSYRVETGRQVERTAIEIAACARPLLRVSEELVLVEPNFKVVDDYNRLVYRFLDTLEELPRQRQKMPHPLKRLELHLERSPREVCSRHSA